MAVSPGGRPADASPIGTPGGRQNWVDKAGGLPRYIRMVAHALIKRGHTPSSAIAIAVQQMKRWASGGGNVSPKVRAAAAKALAEWEAKRGAAHARSAANLAHADADAWTRFPDYRRGGSLPSSPERQHIVSTKNQPRYVVVDLASGETVDVVELARRVSAAAMADPVGTGARFKKLKRKLAAKGAHNPAALAAYIGRKKYGRPGFAALSAAGRGRKRAKKAA